MFEPDSAAAVHKANLSSFSFRPWAPKIAYGVAQLSNTGPVTGDDQASKSHTLDKLLCEKKMMIPSELQESVPNLYLLPQRLLQY